MRRTMLAGAALTALLSLAPAMADVDTAPVKAKWQVEEFFVPYFGLTTYYSCDGIRDKTNEFLKKAGLRHAAVVSTGCTHLTGPERDPSVRIVVAYPIAESVSAAADPKRAELIARLEKRGKTKLPVEPFDAVRKRAVLDSKDRTSHVGGSGDCELLEQLRDRVFKKIGATVVKDELFCVPHQGTVGNPQLEIELLVPVAVPGAIPPTK